MTSCALKAILMHDVEAKNDLTRSLSLRNLLIPWLFASIDKLKLSLMFAVLNLT